MTHIYRQGDVLLIRIDKPNLKWANKHPREGGRVVLAHGEATGHTHVITQSSAMLFERRGERILALEEDAILAHEEHSPIDLPAGYYQVVQQREYNGQKEWAYVED